MSDLEFEKNMQHKLDELNIRPSDAVWTAVEKEIRRDKRRRVLLWFWPFLLLSLATGGYFTWHALFTQKPSIAHVENKNSEQDHAITKITPQAAPTQKDKATTPRADGGPTRGEKNEATTPQPQEQANSTATKTNRQSNANTPSQLNTIDQGLKRTGRARELPVKPTDQAPLPVDLVKQAGKTDQSHQTMTATKNRREARPASTDKQNRPVLQKETITGAENNKDNSEDKATINGQPKSMPGKPLPGKDLASSPPASKQQPPGEPAAPVTDNNKAPDASDSAGTLVTKKLTDSAATAQVAPPAEKKKKKKLHFQFGAVAFAGGGQTASANGLNIQSSPVVDVTGNYYAQASPAAIGPGINSKPSDVRPGLSYTAGIFTRLSTGKRLAFTAGLQYARYSTSITVGDRANTVLYSPLNSARVNGYYRGSNTDPHKYNNHYDLIELPLAVEWQLNRSTSWPIYWSAGPSISYLFNTNALQYDSKNGVYYSDNSLFNRWQIGLSTGFEIGLFNQGRLPLRVGPSFSYGISNLVHQVPDKQHMLSLGLKVKVLLKK